MVSFFLSRQSRSTNEEKGISNERKTTGEFLKWILEPKQQEILACAFLLTAGAGISGAGMSPVSDKSSHAPGIEPAELQHTERRTREHSREIIIQTCPANTSLRWRAGRDACSVLRTSPDELSVTFPSAPHSLSHSVPGQRGPPHPHIVVQSGGKVYPQRSLHASDLHTFFCSQLFSSRPKCVP